MGREAGVDRAVARIQELHPDVVIVDSDCLGGDCADVLRIMTDAAGPRVIGVSRQDNTLCVYHGERRVVRDTSDLLAAIEHQPLPGLGAAS